MKLKSGVERASCDFCHRRKIKCDRASRADQGHADCSNCSLRQVTCRIDDSVDIRIRRRQHTRAQNNTAMAHFPPRPATPVRKQAGAHEVSQDNPSESVNRQDSDSRVLHDLHSPSQLSFGPEHSALTSLDSALGTSSFPSDAPLDSPFELSSDNILFLDEIFLGYHEMPLETGMFPSMGSTSTSTGDLAVNGYEDEGQRKENAGSRLSQDLWSDCNLDFATFTAALHAYFDLAALHLPIIFEDAFWDDYNQGRCGPALAYAIACRGMPFMALTNKWDTQQLLARKFKKAILEAPHLAFSNASMSLDDLEAQALMIDFQYDDEHSLPLESNLQQLFLTHDSLVLMTLRSRHGEDSSLKLARANERRTLLFWHVYGLDAFNCLDRKAISRIQDGEVEQSKIIPNHDTGGYLDAILALAVIARKISQRLNTVAARRRKLHPDCIFSLYDQLNKWQRHDCPAHLQRQRDSKEPLTPAYDRQSKRLHTRLHRAVLWLLEANCYLQIEKYVCDYGFQDSAVFSAEMVAMRVEYESLQAAADIVEISEWIRQPLTETQEIAKHSLVDLAPSILRNICAGICYWTCERGQALVEYGLPSIFERNSGMKDDNHYLRHCVERYVQTAEKMRNTVAAAASHHDTTSLLEKLDMQLSSVTQALARTQSPQ